MTRSLTLKLILVVLVVSLIGPLLVTFVALRTTSAQFHRFLRDRDTEGATTLLEDYYLDNGDWAGLDSFVRDQITDSAARRQGRGQHMGFMGGNIRLEWAATDDSNSIIVAGLGYSLGDEVRGLTRQLGIPVTVDGREVAHIILPPTPVERVLIGAEVLFLSRVNRAVVFGGLGGIVIALVVGALLARTLTRPLGELTAATKAIAQGKPAGSVPVRSRDELGQLAASFNVMSAELVRSREQRQQMVADIAHDLRTPLSLIVGHSEAIKDGRLPPSEDSVGIIHQEALRLNRMIDDLRLLSLAETGELNLVTRPVRAGSLLERVAAVHRPAAEHRGITIEVDIADGLSEIEVDPDRMAQVLDNVMSNAIRSTPDGGQIKLIALAHKEMVRLLVRDSGPGIPIDDLVKVFDRFYRTDRARQRHEGGSGLGLAIARSITESHGGRIWAESQPGGGTTITVELPVAS